MAHWANKYFCAAYQVAAQDTTVEKKRAIAEANEQIGTLKADIKTYGSYVVGIPYMNPHKFRSFPTYPQTKFISTKCCLNRTTPTNLFFEIGSANYLTESKQLSWTHLT